MAAFEKSDEIKSSAFNTAMGYVRRVNGLLDECSMFSRDLDAYNWLHTLRAFDREIDTKMSDEDVAKVDVLLRKADNMVIKEMGTRGDGANSMSRELYFLLDEIEKVLRRNADKADLLAPSKGSLMEALKQSM